MTALLIVLGSLVGGLATLGLVVLVRVVLLSRGMTPEQRQARLNVAQARIAAVQRILAREKRAPCPCLNGCKSPLCDK